MSPGRHIAQILSVTPRYSTEADTPYLDFELETMDFLCHAAMTPRFFFENGYAIKAWLEHQLLPTDLDMSEIFGRAIGRQLEIEILEIGGEARCSLAEFLKPVSTVQ